MMWFSIKLSFDMETAVHNNIHNLGNDATYQLELDNIIFKVNFIHNALNHSNNVFRLDCY